MFSSNSTQLTCGFKVNTKCPEWHKSMTRILKKIKGGELTFDAEEGMAYVSGQGDPDKLLKLMGSIKCKSTQMVFVKTGVRQHQHPHHQYHHHAHHNLYHNSYNSYWPSGLSYPRQHLPYYSHSTAMQPYHHQYASAPDYHHQGSYDPADYPHQEYY